PPPLSPPFPYTTLFRSEPVGLHLLVHLPLCGRQVNVAVLGDRLTDLGLELDVARQLGHVRPRHALANDLLVVVGPHIVDRPAPLDSPTPERTVNLGRPQPASDSPRALELVAERGTGQPEPE